MNKEQLLSKKEQLLSKKEQIEKIAKRSKDTTTRSRIPITLRSTKIICIHIMSYSFSSSFHFFLFVPQAMSEFPLSQSPDKLHLQSAL